VIGSGPKTVNTTTTLPPELQGAQSSDLSTLQNILSSPGAGLEPIQQSSSDAINRAYSALPQTATNALAARGFGSSGKVGDAVYDTEGSRLGAQSDLYGQMAQLANSRQLSAAQIIQGMVAAGRGASTSYPGNGAAAGLTTAGSSLGSLASLLTLQQMINGGGSSSANVPNGASTGPATVNPNTPISIGDVLGTGAIGSPDPTGEGWSN
jgi:hypothetical protein